MVGQCVFLSAFDLRRFLDDEIGATAIEYALIAGLLSAAIIGSVFLLGGGVSDMWNYVRDEVVAATTF
jgi:pilus assembly protein Flp/PilA